MEDSEIHENQVEQTVFSRYFHIKKGQPCPEIVVFDEAGGCQPGHLRCADKNCRQYEKTPDFHDGLSSRLSSIKYHLSPITIIYFIIYKAICHL